jgi:hypothetical protein
MFLRRTHKGLIRILLFLISFQFFSLALTPGEVPEILTEKQYSLKAQHSKFFSLSVFFESTKTEREGEEGESDGEEERLLHCFEIADLSYVSFVLTQFHTPPVSVSPIEQQFDLKPPLFKLHHVYVI